MTLFRTPLGSWHETHGGRLVPFAGWSMPVQYGSIVEEHIATRRVAGVFDVSHMGRIIVSGPAAVAWLDSLLTRRLVDLPAGRCRYTLITGCDLAADEQTPVILDDAVVTREPDTSCGQRLSLVVNASNRERVVAWLTRQLPREGVVLEDMTSDTAMIALQGPAVFGSAASPALLADLCPAADAERFAALPGYAAASGRIAGVMAAVSRTGYTGEDGIEIVVPAHDAPHVWETVVAAATAIGGRACGLGARDTLRLEAGMPLYGHELVESSDPFAIGLGRGIDLEGRRFPGSERLALLRVGPPPRIRIGILFAGRRAARQGDVVKDSSGLDVGVVTSGSFAPTVGVAVAMALVNREAAAPDTSVNVVVRGEPQPGRLGALPFYRRVVS
jgi:aminomethyltransferase